MRSPSAQHFLTIREAADFLGFGHRKTRALIERNYLPARRVDGRIFISADAVADYVIASKRWRRTLGALAGRG
jgi:excisionase family DNA binding protein